MIIKRINNQLFLKGKGRGPETSSLNFMKLQEKKRNSLRFSSISNKWLFKGKSEQPFDKRDCVLICNVRYIIGKNC